MYLYETMLDLFHYLRTNLPINLSLRVKLAD